MTAANHPIAIECLSVFGLPPVPFVELAADLDCRHVTVNLSPARHNPHGYPAWSLRDAAVRQQMRSAMRDRGIGISLGEGFSVRPNAEVRDLVADLDLMAELGITCVNAVSIEPEMSRTVDQLTQFVEMAAQRGIVTTTEIGVGSVPNIATALRVIGQVKRADFLLLIDTMHYFRLGSTLAELAAVDPDLIGYIQLCDVPLKPKIARYSEEALCARMIPGTGELPLLDLLALVPRHVVIGIEVPQRALAESGVGPHERLRPCVEATRRLLGAL